MNLRRLQNTSGSKLLWLPRLLAGGPLVLFSLIHLKNPEHFRDLLLASGMPMVDLNVYAASIAELAAGLLMLTGLFARIGGLLGMGTMVPAIYSTVVLMHMVPSDLPDGVTQVPFVPPIALPIMVLLFSGLIFIFGGGKFSVDRKATKQRLTALV